MSQAFYRKWRPATWDEVVAQEHVVQTLRNAVISQRVGHAYLFSGPRGTGKTTTARLLAKAVNCLDPDLAKRPCNQCACCRGVNEGRFLDLIEIDAASNTSVDDVRDLRDKINFSPSQGLFKVYIIDEVHMLSMAAFNALLKTLEEPPPHAIFILATTEVHKIPATVLSRCQRHEFRRIPVGEIIRCLELMAQEEGVTIDKDALTLIARQSTGSLRDGISLLDQLSSMGGTITLAAAQTVLGTATSQVVIDLVDAIQAEEPGKGFEQIHRALDAGTDPRQFARQVVDYLRNLLLIKLGNADQVDATQEMRQQLTRHAAAFDSPRLLHILNAFNRAAVDQRSAWQPGLALELALVESVAQPPMPESTHSVPLQPRSQPPVVPAISGEKPAETAPSAVERVEKPTVKGRPAAAQPTADTPTASVPPVAGKPETAAGFTLTQVNQNWANVRARVKKAKSQTEGLLNSCRPLGIKDGVLVLGFQSEVLKSKMEANDNLRITQQVLKEVLGVEVRVACVVAAGKGQGIPDNLDVDGDGMVGTALRDLGGEVVDVH